MNGRGAPQREPVRVGLLEYGTVFMDDPGMAGTPSQLRRYGSQDFAAFYAGLPGLAQSAESLGFDSLWLTEHHFQHEGYEVVPNVLMVSAVLAQHTRQLKFGALCNVIPEWHPLRFAEDFAIADLMSGGRMLLGIGRGTVEREIVNFGSVISSAAGGRTPVDDADRRNRAQFEEAMEVVRRALRDESFSFDGRFYRYPPPGCMDRGAPVTDLTLVPKLIRPLSDVEVWQPLGSDDTFRYAAAAGHKGVMYLGKRDGMKDRWRWFGELCAEHGRAVGVGGDRMLVVNLHIGESRHAAMDNIRNGHDEFYKLLAPYGATTSYRDADGSRWQFGRMPTLEESMAQGSFVVGSVGDVRYELGEVLDELQPEVLTVMVRFPGMSQEEAMTQMTALMREVLPAISFQKTVVAGGAP